MKTLSDRVAEVVETAGDRELNMLEGVVATCLLDLVPTLKGDDARRAAIGVTELMRRVVEATDEKPSDGDA